MKPRPEANNFRRESSTIRDSEANRLALFAALDSFLLHDWFFDGIEGLRSFRNQWPAFFPEKVYAQTEKIMAKLDVCSDPLPLAYYGDPYSLVDIWECVESVWSGSERGYLEFLLGLRKSSPPTGWYTYKDERTGEERDASYGLLESRWTADDETVFANWGRGEFEYRGKYDFQRALYLVFKESWRAKVCTWRWCERMFIADKSAQMYCSSGCANKMKSARDRAWWKDHGKAWRDGRKKNRKTKGKRGN